MDSYCSQFNRPATILMNSLMICEKLRHFQLYTSVPMKYGVVSFGEQSTMFCSSTLLELHLTVRHFDECLLLLDGRFSQLRVFFIVTSYSVRLPRTMIDNKVNMR
jgi:hypothetical protein